MESSPRDGTPQRSRWGCRYPACTLRKSHQLRTLTSRVPSRCLASRCLASRCVPDLCVAERCVTFFPFVLSPFVFWRLRRAAHPLAFPRSIPPVSNFSYPSPTPLHWRLPRTVVCFRLPHSKPQRLHPLAYKVLDPAAAARKPAVVTILIAMPLKTKGNEDRS